MSQKLVSQSLAAIGPWAIESTSAMAYLSVLERYDGAVPEAFEGGESSGGGIYTVQSGIAVIEMSGPVTKRPTCGSWLFGGCDSLSLRAAVRAADRDDAVKGILMVFDSPGGEVAGTSDLAADVRNAKKPTRAYVSDLCASAAYWVASACDSIHAGPTAIVGSIGTVLTVRDTSEAESRRGIKVHVVSTGPHKGAGAAGSEISDDHLAEFQRCVDGLNAEFVGAVAAGRGISVEAAKKLADGRVHVGSEAVALGLIDGIASFDEILAGFVADTTPEPSFNWGPRPIVNTTATASSADTDTKPMKLITALIAGLRAQPDAAASLNIEAKDLADAEAELAAMSPAAPAAMSPEIAAEFAKLKADSARQNERLIRFDAEAFVDGAIAAGKMSPVQRDAYIALYIQGVASDGGSAGTNVAALKSAVDVAPQHSFFRSEIPNSDPNSDPLARKPMTPEERKVKLADSALGRKALALMEIK